MNKTTLKLLNDVVLETLEDRRMMSASPTVGVALNSKGVLAVNGSPTANTMVQINPWDNRTELQVNLNNNNVTYYPVSKIKQFAITVGDGSAYIYIDPGIDIPARIQAGNGNDQIRGGAGNDTIIAGNGNDIVYGKGGNNEIQTGSGRDSLQGDRGNDTLIAGNGNDSIVSGGGTDSISGGNGNNTILAGWGHDYVAVGSGKDTIIGGTGNKIVYDAPNAGVGTLKTTPTSGSTTKTTGSSSTGTTKTTTTTTTGTGSSGGTTTTAPKKPTTPTAPTTPVTVTNPTTPVITLPKVGDSNAQAPVAVINTLAGPRVTSMAVNVDATQSTVGTGDFVTTNYAWNFGDAGTEYNQITGFNAGHVYDTPGTYTISLTVTNQAGLVSTTTQKVTITASTRTQIFVDSLNGSDANSGAAGAPLQSLAAAFAKLGDNTEILLKTGETFNVNATLNSAFTNVLIGTYGTGASPIVMRSLGNGLGTIDTYGNTNGLTIQGITFNTPFAVANTAVATKIGIGGIYLGGQNIAVRDCTFLNIDDAINENGLPTGVVIQDNSAPLVTGIRSYFVWGQGAEDTIVGNFVANSTREHVTRLHAVAEVNMQNNNFTNLSRQSVDSLDTSKGCIELQTGTFDWIVNNTVTDGDIRTGPLGLWGEAASTNNTNCVIEDNNLTDTFIFVQSGTHHAMIANNVINDVGGEAITINGIDDQGRESMDITIMNNTATNSATSGNFITVYGVVNGIAMNNNLWVAPNIEVGSYGTAPVYVPGNNMSDFTQISNNIWPMPAKLTGYVDGGINYIGTSPLGNGYLTAAQWDAQSNVGNDVFANMTLKGSYQVTYDGLVAGADIAMAA
jgi:hypothetical protein